MEEVKSFKSKTEKEIRIHKIQFKDKVPIPNIEYSENHEIPKEVIKYYRADEYSYNVVIDKKVWASHPLSFNDPYDCAEQLWNLENFPKEFVIGHLEELKKELKNRGINLKEIDSSDSIESLRKKYFEVYLRMIGIFCVNDCRNSDLFWGYYNSHEGFSIVFDTKILNSDWELIPMKVEYDDIDNFEKLSFNKKEVLGKAILTKILRWATLKKIEWSHENEWRYIFFDIDFIYQNRLKEYSEEAILEVVLGWKFFIEQVNDYRDSRSGDIRSLEFKPHDNQFKLHLLSHVYVKGIDLYQVELSEEFMLRKRKIEILEVKNNKVTIYYTGIIK